MYGRVLQTQCCRQESRFVGQARRAGQRRPLRPGSGEDSAVAGDQIPSGMKLLTCYFFGRNKFILIAHVMDAICTMGVHAVAPLADSIDWWPSCMRHR